MLRETLSNDLFTIFIIIGLITVAITKLIAPKRFNDFTYVIGNSKYLKIYAREQKFLDKFEALLFFNLILSVSVFVYIIHLKTTNTTTIYPDAIVKLATGIAVFILIKVLIERLVASIFEIEKLTDLYLFQKITYKNYLGLLLLPINAILLYSFTPSLNFIYIIIIFLLIINIVGLITSFKAHQSLIKPNLFYFILYLCTLEIAPYIILFKVFIFK
ncbi:DUF4271 domain-containing protein [Aestuariibaculum suncheonense]|uniref:DUF4271 domain-containing protein n=1 Tax=Aestuariibaculum suncheonense TaxID=1028745 RepID=A0A8J6QNY7_9FLAO|nr:DUF4271 domain-containing protein [Aestuariibaculum suncheonense]MBD0834099.1 DUF4271 domain-containing protein [Aestuariibaculum suncheonense]